MTSANSIITAGIDVGASSVKVAIIDNAPGAPKLLSKVQERIRRRDPREVITEIYEQACNEAGVTGEQVKYVASTGEGELVEFRTGHFYGMTTHARGALFLIPEARAALDLGALHARAVRMDERGRVLDYRMTSQCASGSGQFVENIARYLGVSLDDVGRLSKEAGRPEKISGICAVLAETDVINMVSRGIPTGEILRGIHESMANRFVKLLKASKVAGLVAVTGGLAADEGLVACVREGLGEKVEVVAHPDGAFAGAIGGALWGAFRWKKIAAPKDSPLLDVRA